MFDVSMWDAYDIQLTLFKHRCSCITFEPSVTFEWLVSLHFVILLSEKVASAQRELSALMKPLKCDLCNAVVRWNFLYLSYVIFLLMNRFKLLILIKWYMFIVSQMNSTLQAKLHYDGKPHQKKVSMFLNQSVKKLKTEDSGGQQVSSSTEADWNTYCEVYDCKNLKQYIKKLAYLFFHRFVRLGSPRRQTPVNTTLAKNISEQLTEAPVLGVNQKWMISQFYLSRMKIIPLMIPNCLTGHQKRHKISTAK